MKNIIAPFMPQKMQLLLATLCLVFCWPLLGIGQTQENAVAGVDHEIEENSTEVVKVDPQARDEEIARRIRAILEATGRFVDVSIDVREGVAFLEGEVADEARREWVGSLTRRTEGVVAVVNAIEVTEEPLWSLAPALAELQAIAREATLIAPLVLIALIILPLAWFAAVGTAALARRAQRGSNRSPFLRDVIARALATPVFLLGLYIVLQVAGLTQLALSVIGGAGVLGIIVGFAFRDIAENFLASLLLSIRQPFGRGDFIEVAGESGSVRSMNTRSTLLISPDGNHIQIPNSVIFKSTITNYTSNAARREKINVGIGYDASISEAQDIIAGVLVAHPAVFGDPEPMVLVDELGGSTVNLSAYFWFDGHAHAAIKLRSAVLRQLKVALMEGGISMPDDAREVIFPEGVPLLRLSDDGPPLASDEKVAASLNEIKAEETAASTEPEGYLASDAPPLEGKGDSAAIMELEKDDLLAK